MKQFRHIPLEKSSVQYLMSIWKYLNLNPDFQRQGSIWTRSKQQLFIDSILCGFDIPKLYFRSVYKLEKIGGQPRYIRYDVVDGKQRLMAVKDFIDNKYGIPTTSRAFHPGDAIGPENQNHVEQVKYDELKNKFPDLYRQLETYHLDIVSLEDVDDSTADEFFLRLNSGVALNAQEKRNGFSCPFGLKIRELVRENHFMQLLRPRPRYKNDEVLVKLFTVAYQVKIEDKGEEDGLRDTKKRTLDRMYREDEKTEKARFSEDEVKEIESVVTPVLNIFSTIFTQDDVLLRSLGNITVFFYAALKKGDLWRSRTAEDLNSLLRKFEDERFDIRNQDPESFAENEQLKLRAFHLFEKYNTYVQPTNDGSAIKKRAAYINTWIEANGNKKQFVENMKSDPDEKDVDDYDLDVDDKGPSDAV